MTEVEFLRLLVVLILLGYAGSRIMKWADSM